MCKVQRAERQIKFHANTKDELKVKIMSRFTNLNKKTIRKACRRLLTGREAMVEVNGDFLKNEFDL